MRYFKESEGQGSRTCIEWLLIRMGEPLAFQQIEEFEEEHFYLLHLTFGEKHVDPRVGLGALPEPERSKPLFFPQDGIPALWQFARGGNL